MQKKPRDKIADISEYSPEKFCSLDAALEAAIANGVTDPVSMDTISASFLMDQTVNERIDSIDEAFNDDGIPSDQQVVDNPIIKQIASECVGLFREIQNAMLVNQEVDRLVDRLNQKIMQYDCLKRAVLAFSLPQE